MPTLHQHRRRGQVLIMVTLALFVLCGMLGLVVDLGWSYFTKKSAQAAADAAALAAVKAAMDNATDISSYTCGSGGAECLTVPTPCPGVSGNLQSACLYAERHGFETGDRQLVTVQASDRTTAPTVTEPCGQGGATVAHPPTADPPCVDTFYWVTVRVTERVPQLFSSIFGNIEGVVSARATAAVARAVTPASLILINRENDPWAPGTGKGQDPTGTNLFVGGSQTVKAPGGIILASAAHGGTHTQDAYAGDVGGTGSVDAAGGTYIRDDGWYKLSGNATWTIPPTQQGDSEIFWDPYEGLAQPPLTSNTLPSIPIPNGVLDSTIISTYCQNGCPSGNYFSTGTAAGCKKDCATVATGTPITIETDVSFNGDTFGEYYFYGGLDIRQAKVTFGPGRYVFAGTKNPKDSVLSVNTAATLLGGNGKDAGRLFILTDSQYSGLANQIANFGYSLDWGGTDGNTLTFASASIRTGNNEASYISLYGLSKDIGSTVLNLKGYEGMMIWQDRRNSYVHYRDNYTYVDETCGDLNHPCYNYKLSGYPALGSTSPQLELWANAYSHLDGTIYQPRGAWTKLQAEQDYNGPLRIVSGGLYTLGGGDLILTGPSVQTVTYVTALVE